MGSTGRYAVPRKHYKGAFIYYIQSTVSEVLKKLDTHHEEENSQRKRLEKEDARGEEGGRIREGRRIRKKSKWDLKV